MIKSRKTKIKSIGNEEIIMAMTMTKTLITKISIIMRCLQKHNDENENQNWYSYKSIKKVKNRIKIE